MHSHVASFLYFILCVTTTCIAMPCLDIDTSKRVVISWVFLKSTGYSVSQIKNQHWQTILIASIIIFLPASNQLTGQTQRG